MSDLRITQIRKSDTQGDLDYPFLFIHKQFGYSVESIFRPIHTISQIHLGVYPDTFPHTIQEYFWSQTGAAGSDLWIALGQLKNGLYFFYTAQCQDTPRKFLDGGHMNLWISPIFSDIIHFAMDGQMYNKYIEKTKE